MLILYTVKNVEGFFLDFLSAYIRNIVGGTLLMLFLIASVDFIVKKIAISAY